MKSVAWLVFHMHEEYVIPVILCGGTGTRLWPLSRESYPKQYLKIIKDDTDTLLQKTYKRIENIESIKNPIFITNEEHRFIIAEQIRKLGLKNKSIILEPFGKNTAPAIAIAALEALSLGKDPNLLVLASDHFIKDEAQFSKAINFALQESIRGRLVTFGVIPTSPETGYGYIEVEKDLNLNTLHAQSVKNFIEKPNKKIAKELLKNDRYLWNSGMFMFKASVIINELRNFQPSIIESCEKSLNKNDLDLEFKRLNKVEFQKCPDISIDVAVMEKTKLASVVPLSAGWSDIGSWSTLWEISKKDDNGNVNFGNIKSIDSKNNYLRSENRLVVGIGLEDLVVVETKDAVLVANKKNIQQVKDIVRELKKRIELKG